MNTTAQQKQPSTSVVVVPSYDFGSITGTLRGGGATSKPAFSGSSPRNFLLSGGSRVQDTLRAERLATLNPSAVKDLKAANVSLANELTRQRQRHDREVAELKQQLAQVTAEFKAEHAQTDQARELKVAELTARIHTASRTSQHLMELQEQIKREQQMRSNAEAEAAHAWRKVKAYRRRGRAPERNSQAGASEDRRLVELQERCRDLDTRLQEEERRRHRFEASAGGSLEEALQQLIASPGRSGFLGASMKGYKGAGNVSQTPPIPSVEDEEEVLQLEAKLAAADNRCVGLRAALEETEHQLAAMEENRGNQERNLAEAKHLADACSALEDKLEDRDAELRGCTTALAKSEEAIAHQSEQIQLQDAALRRAKRKVEGFKDDSCAEIRHLEQENERLSSLIGRLEGHLQKKEKQLLQKVGEAEDNAAASLRELQGLERKAKDADSLSAELEACRRQMDGLSADCDLQARRAASAIQRQEEVENDKTSLQQELSAAQKREEAWQIQLLGVQHELEQVAVLARALDEANGRWEEDQESLEKMQVQHEQERHTAALELQQLAAASSRIRVALQAAEQLQADMATRLKLSEAEGGRLRGRLAVAEGKLKGLRLELANSSVQDQEQDKRAYTLSELVASVQAEESGKLAAQKEARLARQRLAQAQVKLIEANNARVRAEMQCQETQAELAATKRSQKRCQKETLKLLEQTDGCQPADSAEAGGLAAIAGSAEVFHCYEPHSAPWDESLLRDE